MRSFFHALDEHRVRFLLISGQAAVLYGASTFSEDVDLWVDPAPANWERLLDALAAAEARVYKVTPPLDSALARRGHGFHFTIPADDAADSVGYLDIMGKPPRVASFRACAARARAIETGWGTLPVLAPPDLVLVKRTRRLEDYAVISSLVRIVVGAGARSRATWRWAVSQTFDAEDLLALWRDGRDAWRAEIRTPRPALRLLRRVKRAAGPNLLADIAALLGREMEESRERDRAYWLPIVGELREMHREGTLIREGVAVSVWRSRRSNR